MSTIFEYDKTKYENMKKSRTKFSAIFIALLALSYFIIGELIAVSILSERNAGAFWYVVFTAIVLVSTILAFVKVFDEC